MPGRCVKRKETLLSMSLIPSIAIHCVHLWHFPCWMKCFSVLPGLNRGMTQKAVGGKKGRRFEARHTGIQRDFPVYTGSPFAHKKSQENFERRVHKRAIKAWDADPEFVQRCIWYLRKNAMPGVGMKVTVLWGRVPLGIGASDLELEAWWLGYDGKFDAGSTFEYQSPWRANCCWRSVETAGLKWGLKAALSITMRLE